MKAFRAYGKDCGVIADTPAAAAVKFFATYPAKRKCAVIEGEHDGAFFSIIYGHPWPRSWKDVTPKTAGALQ